MYRKKLAILITAALTLTACAGSKKNIPATEQSAKAAIPATVSLPSTNVSRVVKKRPRTTANRSKNKPANPSFRNRRVVQVAADTNMVNSNIQEGPVRGVHNITSMYGENHLVPVALNYPTTILTTFANPVLMGDPNRPLDYDKHGSTVIFMPKGKRKISFLIVDDGNPRSLPIALTLQPQAGLLMQTINATTGRLSPTEEANGLGGGSFAQHLASVLNDIAKLRIPSGYTVRPLREKIRLHNGMKSTPVERYAGSRFDILRFRLGNNTGITQQLQEEMFGTDKRVRAVAFYPKKVLYPGETTDVLIMTSRNGGIQ